MSNELEIEIVPIVSYIMLYLKKIRKLSAGVTDQQESQPDTVPRQDMQAALDLAVGIEENILGLGPMIDKVRKGWAGPLAEMKYGGALFGAQGIRRTLAMQLERSTGTDIKAVNIRTLIHYENHFKGAEDPLMVMSGEISWNDSFMGAVHAGFSEYVDDLTDITISFIPVIGPIYDISTGIIGYRLPDGHRLTNLDRVLRVISSSVGVLLGVITKGGRATPKLVRALSKARSIEHQQQALVVALNKMTPKQIETFEAVIKAAQSGAQLTKEQQVLLNKLLVGMNQNGIAVQWAKLAEYAENIREKIGSALVFKEVKFKEGEREAIKVLADKLDKTSIIKLPEALPVDFMEKRYLNLQKLRAQDNVRHADLLVENVLADIYTPKTDEFKAILKTLALKNSQATMIVINMDKSKLAPIEVIKQMGRLWGKMDAIAIDRVIVLDSKGFFQYINRPVPYRVTDLGVFPFSTLSGLKELWEKSVEEKK